MKCHILISEKALGKPGLILVEGSPKRLTKGIVVNMKMQELNLTKQMFKIFKSVSAGHLIQHEK